MKFTDAFLSVLTNSVPGNENRDLRQKLEACLVPMIRCALRSGLGQPELVRWVQSQRQENRAGADLTGGLDHDARCMARLLSSSLLQQLRERSRPSPWAAETVVGL
jgi:hypothetical protein